MRCLKDVPRLVLAFAAAVAVAGVNSPAKAEPYLFNHSVRTSGVPGLSESRAHTPTLQRSRGQNSQPARPVATRAAPSPSNICRRLVRDARYGYVERQFAC